MSNPKRGLLILLIFFLPIIGRAEGQEGLVYILDALKLLFVLFIWLILLLITLLLLKKRTTLKIKIGIACLYLAFATFHFIMVKSDPYPYEGPIDEFIHRDMIKAGKTRDSLELLHGKPDSTIETTIASVDTNEIGVYIWLKGQSIFVRKLTPDLGSQRRNDSLTMSIVRSWKNSHSQ
jgi:hypothetical protein